MRKYKNEVVELRVPCVEPREPSRDPKQPFGPSPPGPARAMGPEPQ